MADGQTTHYEFTKPEVGASNNSWGNKTNDNWDDLDDILWGFDSAITAISATLSGLGDAATKDVGTTAGTVAAGDDSRITGAAPSSRSIASGDGLTGGGDLSGDRTLAVGAGTGIVVAADAVSVDKASDANVRASVADKVLTADRIESASAVVALTAGSTVALDWDTGINFSLTTNQNCTLSNPTNGQPGTWRSVLVTNGASHTMAYGNQYKFPGGVAPVIAASSGLTRLTIFCRSSTVFEVYAPGIGLA
jgi:hypothetical protein